MGRQLLFDADQHTIEPPDMWARYLPKKFQDMAPRVVKDEKGGDAWQFQPGVAPMPIGLVTFTKGDHHYESLDWFGRTYESINRGCFDGKGRLDDLDFDGVQAACFFPSQRTMAYFMDNPDDEFVSAGVNAYNNWLFEEFCGADRNRLVPLAQMPDLGIEGTVEALTEAKKKGFPGVILSRWPSGGAPFSQADERFWATAEEMDMPVHFHVGVRPSNRQQATASSAAGGASGGSTNAAASMAQMGGAVGDFSSTISASIFSGVLDRYPKIRFVGAEVGAGWVPSLLEFMDDHYWRNRTRVNSALQHLPSEYFRRNWKVTFIREPFAVRNRYAIGVENMMWSSDYPHHRADWPYSRRLVEEMMEDVSETERRTMTWDNAVSLYGVKAPATV